MMSVEQIVNSIIKDGVVSQSELDFFVRTIKEISIREFLDSKIEPYKEKTYQSVIRSDEPTLGFHEIHHRDMLILYRNELEGEE